MARRKHSQEALPLVVAVAAGLLGRAGGFKSTADGVALGDNIKGEVAATLGGGGKAAVPRGTVAVREGMGRHGCLFCLFALIVLYINDKNHNGYSRE